MNCGPPFVRGSGCCRCCPPDKCIKVNVNFMLMKCPFSSSSSFVPCCPDVSTSISVIISGCGHTVTGTLDKNPFSPTTWDGDADDGTPGGFAVVKVDCGLLREDYFSLGAFGPYFGSFPNTILSYDADTNTFFGSAASQAGGPCNGGIMSFRISNPCDGGGSSSGSSG